MSTSVEERFFAKVQPAGDCWIWTAAKDRHGYGKFSTGTRAAHVNHYAHRWAWAFFNGPIPEGLTLDHLCRNRACVRPDHLDPCPHAVNLSRGKHRHERCRSGLHEMGGTNVYENPSRPGSRQCRACMNEASRRAPKKQHVHVG